LEALAQADAAPLTAGASPPVTEIRPRTGLFDLQLGEVWRYRELLFFLTFRDIRVRYKQAALGAGWAVIQPLFAVMIFTLIFGMFARIPSDGVPYPLFAFAAMLPWTYFSEAARRSALGLVGDAPLISKIYFPRLIIPISNVLTPLVDFAVAFVVFLGVMAWYGFFPSWHILLVPVLLLVSMLLGLAVGLWLGPINVRYRDITHTLPFLLQIWLYATPIVYPLSMVPERFKAVYSLNPMVGVIEGFRWALLGKGNPDFQAMTISGAVIIIALVGGLFFFKRSEPKFPDII
jgi:lipopolysaccharide transport system permease protein